MTEPRPLPVPSDVGGITDPRARGPVRLLGGPGTGKTTLLVDAVAAHICAGVEPESVLLLCSSSRAAARCRAALAAAWPRSAGRTAIREPLVRTVHSYAFAVLLLAAQRAGDPPPRLVTATEQEGIVAELLAGDLADKARAAVAWPEWLRPALSTAGFATQLRDLMARCAERGVDPLRLQRIGRLAGRPEWVAAGQFAQQYEQVMLLRAAAGMAAPQATVPALGAAELVGAALEAFATDAALLAAERRRVRVLLVDDAQQLDPQAARLVRLLAAGAARTVIAGDPNQGVFGFRGADPALLDGGMGVPPACGGHPLAGDDDPTVVLTRSHRCAPAVAELVSDVAARLPGRTPCRDIEGTGDGPGSVSLRVAASVHAEAALIADTLRRAYLLDGLPWSQMAVIVRSLRHAGVLVRALTAAGVPVGAPPIAAPPAEHPAVRALLTVLSATAGRLDAEQALELLTGPIGRVDPVSLRRLRQTLGPRLVDVLTVEEADLPAAHAGRLRRVRAVLRAAAAAGQRDPRYPLWQAWHRSGLQQRWLAASAIPGRAGMQADRDLDAVAALFDIADSYVAHTAGASVRGLVDHVRNLRLPPPQREPLLVTETVSVVSAHAALGREWDLVVVAGLQDGVWPNTTPRGGVLGTQQLVDRIDGIVAPVSDVAPALAEERRLLVAALGRSRRRLLITAVEGEHHHPSQFFDELSHWVNDTAAAPPSPPVLSPAALIGRLRSVVCAPAGAVDDARRLRAATQLARLARAGVPGADPAGWYGMTAVSTAERLRPGGRPATLSPSALQTLDDCPLRWLLERHGGTDGPDLRAMVGLLVHAVIAGSTTTEAQLAERLESAWHALPFGSAWYSRNELDRHRAMVAAFARWRAMTRGELTEVGTEVAVDGVLAHPDPALPDVRVRGRIDRLERDAEGRLVVVDVKTGTSPVGKRDAQRHAQLAMYQLAIAAGLLSDGDQTGGARLVYVARTGADGVVQREQDPLTRDARREWQDLLHRGAAAAEGPLFVARVNEGCAHCPVRSSCPAH